MTPGERLLVPQPWASWFEFATPDLPVAVDSRIELFPNDVWAGYLDGTQGGDGWEEVLEGGRPTLVDRRGTMSFVDRLAAAGTVELHDG